MDNSEPGTPPLPNWGPPTTRPAAPRTAMLSREVPDRLEGPESGRERLRNSPETRGFQAPLIVAVTMAALLIDLAVRSRVNSLASLAAAATLSFLILSSPARRKPTVVVAVALALAAVAVTVFRASTWVVVPALAVAFGGLVAASQDLLAKPRWSSAWSNYLVDLTTVVRSGFDQTGRARPANTPTRPVARALILSTVVVIPLGMLLASGDAAFRGLLLGTVDSRFWSHVIVTAMIIPLVAALAVSARASGEGNRSRTQQHQTLSMLEGSVVLGAVITLLTVWGATQVIVALGGAERLLATADLTAAENARGGFFQLSAATAILLVVIIAADRLTVRTTAADRMRFLGLTSVIAVETLGLVFASYGRLSLYVSGFGNTMLRYSVAWFLAWLAAVMVVLVVSINRPKADSGQAGSIIFILASVWIIAFGLVNPEARVANQNLERQQALVGLDTRYLGEELGADATPLLVESLPELDAASRQDLITSLCRGADRDPGPTYGWLSWNRSSANAEAAIAELDCP